MKRRRIVIGSLVVVALAGLAWFVLDRPEPEPVYQGKTLTQWLQLYKTQPKNWDHFEEPDEWGQADEAIRQMGTNAYPFLLDMMRAFDAPWKLKFIALAQKQRLVTISHIPATERNRSGTEALSRLAGWPFVMIPYRATLPTKLKQTEADQLVPALVDIFRHGHTSVIQSGAAYVLGDVGPPARAAVPVLVGGVTNTAPLDIRLASIRALGNIRSDSHLAVPAIAGVLTDTNQAILEESFKAIGLLPPDPASASSVVSNLTAFLVANTTNAPYYIQYLPPAIANYGASAKPALPALLNFVKATHRSMQFLIRPATEAIWKIDPEFAAAHESEIGRPMVIPTRPT